MLPQHLNTKNLLGELTFGDIINAEVSIMKIAGNLSYLYNGYDGYSHVFQGFSTKIELKNSQKIYLLENGNFRFKGHQKEYRLL